MPHEVSPLGTDHTNQLLDMILQNLSNPESGKSDVPYHQKIINDSLMMAERIRVRLGGIDSSGYFSVDRVQRDKTLLKDLESPLAHWIDQLHHESNDHKTPRDSDGLNPAQRKKMEQFHRHGGHVSRYSDAQREYIFRHGLVAFIEFEVQKNVWAVVGAVSGLTRNPYTDADQSDDIPREDHGLHKVFPQFDLRDLLVHDDDKPALKDIASHSFLVCRSTVLEHLGGRFVNRQIGGKKVDEKLVGLSLRRHGLAAFAKAHLLSVAKEFGNTNATSNIGSLRYKGGHELPNVPSTKFNDPWMRPMGWRGTFSLRLDSSELSDLHMSFQGYQGSLEAGLHALIGEDGIATRKHLDVESVPKTVQRMTDAIHASVASGDHAEW